MPGIANCLPFRTQEMEEAMDEIVARIATNLEAQTSISLSFFRDVEKLLDYTVTTKDKVDFENMCNEISAKGLTLTSLVNAASSAMESGAISQCSISAAKVYLLLILTPNAPVFSLFTPVPFLNLLRVLRLAVMKPSLASEDVCGSASLDRKTKRKKRKSTGGSKKSTVNDDSIDNGGEEGTYDAKDLFFLLDNLVKVIGLVTLNRFPDCLKALVRTVCQIPLTAAESLQDMTSFVKFCDLCSLVLQELLKPEQGNQADTAVEILKSLAPLILLPKSHVRTFALGFVVDIMVKNFRSSNDIITAVANMPKYLVQKAPEKAEPRGLAVESILSIVKVLDLDYQVGFVDYVLKISQGKGNFRLLSVDLIPDLIILLRSAFGSDMGNGVDHPFCLNLIKALVERCSDSIAGIRARAMTRLSNIIVSFSDDDGSKLFLREVLGLGHPASCGINNVLKKRCMDEKAVVRRAALLLISKFSAFLGGELDEELTKTIGMACSDPLVSIRKVAISALSEAFKRNSSHFVTKEWLHSVPRLIVDNETSIQDECQTLFLELVLNRVTNMGLKLSPESHDLNVNDKGVLELLKEMRDGEVSPWIKKICSSLGKKKKLRSTIVTALQNIIRTSESQWKKSSHPIEKWTAPPGTWFLLSETSAFLQKALSWEFLHHHWQLLDKFKTEKELEKPTEKGKEYEYLVGEQAGFVDWMKDRVFLLQTISNASMEMPPEPAADLAQCFLVQLERFDMHPTEVDAHIKALKTLCKRKALNNEEADSLVSRWVKQLLIKASSVLEAFLSMVSSSDKEKIFNMSQSTGNCMENEGVEFNSKLLSQAAVAVYTIGSLVVVCPSANLKAVIPTVHAIITSGSPHPKSSKLPVPQVSLKSIALSVYINAWLTLGKICLADSGLAKRYLPLFLQELEMSNCAAIRNNIVVMMADFCVRYTAMVDSYIPKITKYLCDPCELVRRQTFILLSRLLQRDYVKWRGVLFLRFLLCLVDDSQKIRQLADYLFGNILKAKAPLLAYNSFVEAIFVLNDYNPRTGCGNSSSSRDENHLFSIRGNDDKSRSQRKYIYETLLKQMAPEHLLATFAKICAEILAAASEEMLSMDDAAGHSVLQDAFSILSCKEIRIQTHHGSSSDSLDPEEDIGETSTTPQASAASKGRVISQALRKGLIQNSIPIFIELKRLLERKNSALIGSLMDCLRILLKDYKNEIDDMLVADKQLYKEIIHDMDKYEAMKAKNIAAATFARRSQAYATPQATNKGAAENVISENDPRVRSAIADAVAASIAKTVLRQANNNLSSPLSAISVPKLKSTAVRPPGGVAGKVGMPAEVIESLRRPQLFELEDEKI